MRDYVNIEGQILPSYAEVHCLICGTFSKLPINYTKETSGRLIATAFPGCPTCYRKLYQIKEDETYEAT